MGAHIILFLALLAYRIQAFNVAGDRRSCRSFFRDSSILKMSVPNEDTENDIDEDDLPIIAQSTVKIDDHGSDLTNRFKYKVNIAFH